MDTAAPIPPEAAPEPSAAPDLSPLALILEADPVVQAVVALLVLASVACWAILFDKLVRIGSLKRQVGRLERQLAAGEEGLGLAPALGPLGEELIEAALAEDREQDPGESRADRRARVERAARAAAAAHLRRAEPGLPFLATIGSAAPFVGLFGTVWGIMRSFTAIAATNDTSLAVVAPGIAEALFATALGLAAAIPAVMAYNKLVTDLGRLGQRLEGAVERLGALLARAPRRAA